jgi:ligand-binding sensor domain-containing protein
VSRPTHSVHKYPLIGWILPVLIIASSASWAQHFSFKSYTQDQGLTNLSVSTLLQDRNGFLWVGTNNGLFWYEGKLFHEFAANDLTSKRIVGLNETPDGTLWIATQLGLYQRHGVHLVKVDPGEPIEVTGGSSVGGGSIASDSNNEVYLATRQGLLRVWGREQGFSFEWLSRIAVDSVGLNAGGRVWFGCGESLCRIDSGRVTDVRSQYQLPAEHWSSITADGSGNLWIRSPRRLFELARGSERFAPKDATLRGTGTSYGQVYRSSDGQVMVAMNSGLAISEGDHWRLIDSAGGLAGDSVASILHDREGSLWIGLHGTGLMRWLGYKNWESWTKGEGLSSDMMWAIRRDAAGVLWAGTENGLNEMRPGVEPSKSWRQHDELKGMKVRAVASMAKRMV